ncbi:hypothetical protein [Streptomyces parvulus]|uniref:Uncharacterized protein n=1 Tax=Streptomyces parvulus TaxID=146923 RepID=A0A369V0X7_9ACTN|nr:hypothetical protein [Streptomyces parvulus]RDD86666.1 hypothetical protein DVZ84_23925 [Streptomyces parvulus]
MILLIPGAVLLTVAAVNVIFGQATIAVITGVVGLILVLAWIFRHYSHRGDYSRSGNAGQ